MGDREISRLADLPIFVLLLYGAMRLPLIRLFMLSASTIES